MPELNLGQLSSKLKIGISQCLLGEKVRYDGNDKQLDFAVTHLKPYANFYTICPEMAIGLPSPRPTLGLYQLDDKSIIIRFNERQTPDNIDEKIRLLNQEVIPNLSNLCGYIVCAKSPSCGLNNAKVYGNNTLDFITISDGLFTKNLRQQYPWMPVEDNLNLGDTDKQTHFSIRILALHRLNELNNRLSRKTLLTFHSRYKLLLLSHSQPLYRKLGPFVAQIDCWDNLHDFFIEYRQQLMNLLSIPAMRKNHTNVLMHIQGYFKNDLSSQQKQDLTNKILAYHDGQLPLSNPVNCLKHYLSKFPNNYLLQQYYFYDYPEPLQLK